MEYPKVILVGGPPLVGKTKTARGVAASTSRQCISCDDLGEAVVAVTSVYSHPSLHPMGHMDAQRYYLTHNLVRIILDAEQYHEALWPAIERVIHNHATWDAPAIIEGWALLPERVAKLNLSNVVSVWMVATEDLYTQRLKDEPAYWQGCEDPEKLMHQLVRRSMWYDTYMRKLAAACDLPLLEVTKGMPVLAVQERISNMLLHCKKAG